MSCNLVDRMTIMVSAYPFVIIDLHVMTELSIPYRHDVVFLQEHSSRRH